jgi:hypothetical protein
MDMAETTTGERIALIEALIELSSADLPYSDLYLHRAETLFAEVLTRDQYVALARERAGLHTLAKQLRRLAESGAWLQVRALAKRGITGVHQVSTNERLLAIADVLYEPRVLRADATALALSGATIQSTPRLGRAHEHRIARLRFALAYDPEGAALYRARLAHLESLTIVVAEADAPPIGGDVLQQRILAAADREDFEEADRLTAALIEAAARNEPGRLRAAPSSNGRMRVVADPFAPDTVRRADEFGLSAVSLSHDSAGEGWVRPGLGTVCRDGVPAISAAMRDSLDLLQHQPFVTSAGSRYLPGFDSETLLVETFPEQEPGTETGLLRALGLRKRQGITRLAIEDAVRSHTAPICLDLGLDPLFYAIVPIPFDAYVRLAPRFDWGRQRRWTHFDGYQLTRGLRLRALVGGDAHYGGAGDLCSVERDYETDRLVARFAVVHRDRLTA